jgi:hypothetical protein
VELSWLAHDRTGVVQLTPIDDLTILVACIPVYASRAYQGDMSSRSLSCQMLARLRWVPEWRERQNGVVPRPALGREDGAPDRLPRPAKTDRGVAPGFW